MQSLLRQQFAGKAGDKAAFDAFLATVFGPGYDRSEGEALRQRALKGDFSWMPPVQWVDANTLGGANGAFNAEAGVVYLNADLKGDPELAARTYVEEAGHYLDTVLNTRDASGDEGELFRRLLSGEPLSRAQIRAIQAEDDSGTIIVDGKEVAVEFWNPFKAVAKAVKSVGKAIGGAVKSVGKAVGSVVSSVGQTVGGFFKQMTQGVGGFFTNIFRGKFGAAFDSLWTGIDKGILQGPAKLVDGIFSAAQILVDGFAPLLGPLGKPLKWIADRGLDIGRTVSQTALGILRELVRTPVEVFRGLADSGWRGLKKLFKGDIGGAFEAWGKGVLSAGKRALGGIADVAAQTLAGAVSAVGTLLGFEQPARPLSEEEKRMLRQVYGDSVDLDRVRVKRGGWVSYGAARTVGDTIYLPDSYFDADGDLNTRGSRTLTHEMGHVWQFQNGGADYIHESLWAQAKATLDSGDRGGAYDWRQGMNEGKSFAELNPEQQASVIEEITLAMVRGEFTAAAYSAEEYAYLVAALAAVRAGRGAP